MKHFRYFTVALLSFFVGTLSALAEDGLRSIGGLEYIAAEAPAPVVWRSDVPATVEKSASESGNVRFSTLPPDRLEKVQEANAPKEKTLRATPLQIGVNRFFSTEAENKTQPILSWQKIDGGSVAYLSVTSPEAAALRVGLKTNRLPANAELRFSGSANPENIVGIISGQEVFDLRSDNNTYWTPMTDGETQTIEIFVPAGNNADNISFDINAASHIFISASDGFDTSKVQKASDYCEINVACKYSELGTTFQNATKAVARMVFSEGGSTYTCTGTLLNNAKQDHTPYFWSAAHCINTQTAANTLNTYWFDESSSCYGTSASTRQQLSGGATLLHVNNAADTLLLKLNNAPPSGAVFAGWNSASLSSGGIIGIHHPSGDIKKVSVGRSEGVTCNTLFTDDTANTATLDLVSWQQGTTEGGSSGSGLFTLSSGTYQLRGGLMGGAAGCNNTGQSYQNGNADCYSSLNRVWSSIKPHLSPETTNANLEPSHNYRGLWYGRGEGGWGLTIDQYSYTNGRKPYLYVAWYAYDKTGKARWLLFQGDWTKKDSLSADVYQYTGTPWGPTTSSGDVKNTKVGTATLTFTSAKAATFSYNVDGVQRTLTVNKSE